MPLILQPQLVSSQPAWEQMLIFQRLIALTEKLQFAMERELMESQIFLAPLHFQSVMDFQVPTDIQELIVFLHHSQHVEVSLADNQELTVKSEDQMNFQLQLILQLFSKKMLISFKSAMVSTWTNVWLPNKWLIKLRNLFNFTLKNKSQPALIDTLSTANQFVLNLLLQVALNKEHQLHIH